MILNYSLRLLVGCSDVDIEKYTSEHLPEDYYYFKSVDKITETDFNIIQTNNIKICIVSKSDSILMKLKYSGRFVDRDEGLQLVYTSIETWKRFLMRFPLQLSEILSDRETLIKILQAKSCKSTFSMYNPNMDLIFPGVLL